MPVVLISLLVISAAPTADPLIEARVSTAERAFDKALVQLDAAEAMAEDPKDQAEIKHLRGIAQAATGHRSEAVLSFVLAAKIDPATHHPTPSELAPLVDCGRALAISGLDAPGIENRVRRERERDDWVCPVIVVGGAAGPGEAPRPVDEVTPAELIAQPTPPEAHAWRWSWIGAGVALVAAGLAVELTRDTSEKRLAAGDFAGPGMMLGGAGSVLVGWLTNPFEAD